MENFSFDRTLKVNVMVDNCKDEILEQFPRSSKILKRFSRKTRTIIFAPNENKLLKKKE